MKGVNIKHWIRQKILFVIHLYTKLTVGQCVTVKPVGEETYRIRLTPIQDDINIYEQSWKNKDISNTYRHLNMRGHNMF